MKTLGELRVSYAPVLRDYNVARFNVRKELEAVKEKMEHIPGDKEAFSKQAASLELQYKALDDKYNFYQEFANQYMEPWSNIFQLEAAKQQGEAQREAGEELNKVMTVARRMCRGDIVPGSDEKKLMEYDPKLYMMAKNAQAVAQMEERKKHKSLWEDEEKEKMEDPMDIADSTPTNLVAPEIISVDETMASALDGSLGEATVDIQL